MHSSRKNLARSADILYVGRDSTNMYQSFDLYYAVVFWFTTEVFPHIGLFTILPSTAYLDVMIMGSIGSPRYVTAASVGKK